MENFNNDDIKKMLEMLKEQAESTSTDVQEHINTQTTDDSVHTDEDIKNMLKKHFAAEENEDSALSTETYSLDEVDDFAAEEEYEAKEPEIALEAEESINEQSEPIFEIEEDNNNDAQYSFVVEKIPDEPVSIQVENDIETVIDEAEVEGEVETELGAQENEEGFDNEEPHESELEDEEDYTETDKGAHIYEQESEDIRHQSDYLDDDEPVSEESINYDEVLEGQQGTVFNKFVEDFTGELDDVVFEAEITESRAPDKQYTIFEDWDKIIKDKDYSTAEEEIIPPDDDDLEKSAEINRNQQNKTDYFKPIVSDNDLDAVDIALMVALGGESELNETVGFEKIRQAVYDSKEEDEANLDGKHIYGFTGDEYSSLVQNIKIKKQYINDKVKLIFQAIGTGLFAVALLAFEIMSWISTDFSVIPEARKGIPDNVLISLLITFVCVVISFDKIIKLIKEPISFSSLSYVAALIAFLMSIIHDILLSTWAGYVHPTLTFHFPVVILLLIGIIYDMFDFTQQSYMFNIISLSDKKLVLEPYGKINTDDDDGEMIESDSYCISRVPSIKKYFARTSTPASASMSRLIPLVLCFSIAICVMLLLLLRDRSLATMLFGFFITLSFLLICACIFESEYAFFAVHKALKKYKTGIIGKASVAEYGKCKIIYFDDFNVFNKKSVRTKGLKLYDNNEIYRILYHTQAVFSKVGGPLKGVFEFATTEMTHSKNVEIKEISQEGISAIVDGRTSVLIGTGAFMRSRYIHPSYTAADLKIEEKGEESIMFIALNGVLGAKLYVTYQFSSEFERLARKLTARGIKIGIRSADPNVNNKWAKKYGEAKRYPISIVRPTLKEMKPNEKSIESGIVSVKNVRALSEALMMCVKLNGFEALLSKVRVVALILIGILSFALILLPDFGAINIMTILALTLASAVCASIMMLLSHFYIKN